MSNGRTRRRRSFEGDGNRLVNYYVGVFRDFSERVDAGRTNLDIASPIHNLSFAAAGK